MYFNTEKFNFQYEGYELSRRKVARNEAILDKLLSKVKSQHETLNKKAKGKTFGASLFGKRELTKNEANQYHKLGKASQFMNEYGKIKESLSGVMLSMMNHYATGKFEPNSVTQYNNAFDSVIESLQNLKKDISTTTSTIPQPEPAAPTAPTVSVKGGAKKRSVVKKKRTTKKRVVKKRTTKK